MRQKMELNIQNTMGLFKKQSDLLKESFVEDLSFLETANHANHPI